MGIYKRGDLYWYRFNWNGETMRESTKTSNKRVAAQIESARKTALAKGEVGDSFTSFHSNSSTVRRTRFRAVHRISFHK